MGQEYQNISSQWSIVEPKTDWICGNITYDWYAGLKHKQNYIGVTEAFHGADLTQISTAMANMSCVLIALSKTWAPIQ